MLEPPALKREIVIDNFARGWGIQVLKEGLEHAVDSRSLTIRRVPQSTYPTTDTQRERGLRKKAAPDFTLYAPLRAEQIRSNTSRASAIDSKDGCGFRPALDPLPE